MARVSTQRIGRPLRAYVDTSVFGGVHDDEFRVASEQFFAGARAGAITLLVSAATADEIAGAPSAVQEVFGGHAPYMELLENTPEMLHLAEPILPPAWFAAWLGSTHSTSPRLRWPAPMYW
jgi:hypothetical protein